MARERRRSRGPRSALLLLAFIHLGVAVPSGQQHLGSRPSVLLLIPLPTASPLAQSIESAFRLGLAADYKSPVDVRVEYLDLPDGQKTSYLPQLTKFLSAKYGAHRFDVVVAHRSEALEYFLANRQAVFLGASLVAMDLSQTYLESLGSIPNATGALLVYDRSRAVRQMLALRPGTRHVALVGGGSEFDRQAAELMLHAFKEQTPPVEVLALNGLTLDEQLRQVSTLPEQSVVFVTSYRADSQGQSMLSEDVVSAVTASANAPTFGFSAPWLGSGIVGGDLLQYDVLARRVADLTARILKGQAASSIPYSAEPWSALMFDWRELERWKIDESLLPAGSTVLFRRATLWSEYKTQVILGITIVAAQGLLLGALLFERRKRRRAQVGLIEAEQRYRTVADFTADWEYWMMHDGSFAYVSPSCLQITGYESAEFIRHPGLMLELIVEDDRAAWTLHHRLSPPITAPLNIESRIRTKSGEVKWLDVAVSPVAAADGTSLGIRGSARDVTAKKRSEEELRQALDDNRRLRDQLEIDNTYLREEAQRDSGLDGILGSSEVMGHVVSKVRQVAPTPSTVLLLGETGVGKNLLAQALHQLSSRRARPLVTLNCAALPPSLVETELFGHERGSFTGAHARRIGRFEIAHGGTLFLDEIGELPLDLQAKLLRTVQDGVFERVGSNVAQKTDVRLIVATNRQLDVEVQAGRFRQDLWYRLNMFPITVPPLRQRPEDIPVLVAHFVRKHCRELGRPVLEVSRATMGNLQAHTWPGNVRELENVIERAVILSRGKWIEVSAEDARSSEVIPTASPSPPAAKSNRLTMEGVQREHILSVLADAHWRVEGPGGAAELLGMNPNTLRSRMRKLGIQRPGGRATADYRPANTPPGNARS